jgi:hypothetical protein
MTPADFRRIALSFPGTEEGEHAGQPDFRLGKHKFATLASVEQGYGNLILTPDIQAGFLSDAPSVFIPIAGGWGRMGHTHIVLSNATEDIMTGALRAAWKIRNDKNTKPKSKKKTARQPK